jgi:mannose-6-phosphate isomerase-like protein (cupin superfamily)
MGSIVKMEDVKGGELPEGGSRAMILSEKEGAKELGGFYIVKPPGSRSRYHYHERRESVWFVLEGEIEATIDGKTERIGPNTLVFTQPGQKHRLTVVGDKDLRMIEFFTHPEPDMIYVE